MKGGFVHIVESPGPLDLLDGRTEGRVLSEALSLAGINHRYNLVVDRKTLILALRDRISTASNDFQSAPIVHLSMHGEVRGLALTNGDFITWVDLREILTPLLQAMNGGLLLTLSACESGHGIQMAMHTEAIPPFWALVGHVGSPFWNDAAVGFVTFYHHLFKGHGIPECVGAMRAAAGDVGFMAFDGVEQRNSWIAFQSQRLAEIGRASCRESVSIRV